jgi:hypothetical protein
LLKFNQNRKPPMNPETHKLSAEILDVRPFQIMCLICWLGRQDDKKPNAEKHKLLFSRLHKKPLQLIRLCCNVDAYYHYQNPGADDNTPEGGWFNVKRDLDIMQKLGLVPGDTRPAHELFNRFSEKIKDTGNICGFKGCSIKTWEGCAFAGCGDYEAGLAKNITEKIFPPRSSEELDNEKEKGIAEIQKARILNLIPMHLMCLACFHKDGGGLGPIKDDLLFEVWEKIRETPEIPVRIVRKDCMICKSCKVFNPNLKMCVHGGKIGAELRQLHKELNILQTLGLEFDDILPANKLFKLVKDKIPSNYKICAYDSGVITSCEWNICCCEIKPEGTKNYTDGLEKGCIYNEKNKPRI